MTYTQLREAIQRTIDAAATDLESAKLEFLALLTGENVALALVTPPLGAGLYDFTPKSPIGQYLDDYPTLKASLDTLNLFNVNELLVDFFVFEKVPIARIGLEWERAVLVCVEQLRAAELSANLTVTGFPYSDDAGRIAYAEGLVSQYLNPI